MKGDGRVIIDRRWYGSDDFIASAKPGGYSQSLDRRQVINAIMKLHESMNKTNYTDRNFQDKEAAFYQAGCEVLETYGLQSFTKVMGALLDHLSHLHNGDVQNAHDVDQFDTEEERETMPNLPLTPQITIEYRADATGRADSQTFVTGINGTPQIPELPDALRLVNHYAAQGYRFKGDMKAANYRWMITMERDDNELSQPQEYMFVHSGRQQVFFVNRRAHTLNEDFATFYTRMHKQGWVDVYTYGVRPYRLNAKVLRRYL